MGSFLAFEKYWVFLGVWDEDAGVDWVWILLEAKAGKSWVDNWDEGDLGVEPKIWR